MSQSSTQATADPRLESVEHAVVRHAPVESLEEAARIRGLEPGAVIKTMVVRRADEDYVFVLVPGNRVIDWPKLRELLGERRLSMPDADEAEAVTGYRRGTITPFGASTPWPVIADRRLTGGLVSVGGGEHGVSITLAGEGLIAVLEASLADVTKPAT